MTKTGERILLAAAIVMLLIVLAIPLTALAAEGGKQDPWSVGTEQIKLVRFDKCGRIDAEPGV